ncbi:MULTISPECIES: helix-turn-helix transcriptional regulator [Dactylosporangium]|uniref:Transcriptional regulator n=2 Tax=Dactylosporangium TaxID=35753 RepID=A0A9W6KKK7_9ACTN|nr:MULTISPECIES: YafY family protein [Dactylosporangium]UAB94320.1 YafY family transcriptional regulator [Dactylosporangium vinaceum]UWZ42719.1 YafY family transcriptional regulator [Dactylosporangium matsuzakiense]GLL03797.1 transcriptional regulator [Dactylosporangium matsuzakiense]
MSQSTGRVLALLEVLQAQPGLTGPQLAERLGIDERTVRRYAAALAGLGLPVSAGRGRYGGYRLAPGFRLPPLMLGDDEAVAVVLGLLAAERLGLGVGAPARASALAKIERVLPAALRERVRAVRETLGFTQPPRAAGLFDVQHLLAIGEAVRDSRRVGLTYRSWRGEETTRDFDPYGVVFHNARWYTTGLDHRSGELRTLRLDRIEAVALTADTFEPPPSFDPAAHVVDALAAVPYRHEVEVLLHAPVADVRRRVPATAGTATPAPGGATRLTCRAEHLSGMAQMLAGLGWDFTVVRPPELRTEVADLGRRLLRHAGPPPG